MSTQTESGIPSSKSILEGRDYYLLIDKSGSMSSEDCPNGKSRWAYAQEETENLARTLGKFDPDGATYVPFSQDFTPSENTTADKVHQIFQENQPGGSTNTAAALKWAIEKARSIWNQNKRPSTIVVMTDGAPDSQEEVANVIVEATKSMNDRNELSITFFQVGNDQAARKFLEYLDNDLVSKCGAKLDIVDTKNFDELSKIGLTKALELSLTD